LGQLADVRVVVPHLPVDRRMRPTWRHVAAELAQAAAGAAPARRAVARLDRMKRRPVLRVTFPLGRRE